MGFIKKYFEVIDLSESNDQTKTNNNSSNEAYAIELQKIEKDKLLLEKQLLQKEQELLNKNNDLINKIDNSLIESSQESIVDDNTVVKSPKPIKNKKAKKQRVRLFKKKKDVVQTKEDLIRIKAKIKRKRFLKTILLYIILVFVFIGALQGYSKPKADVSAIYNEQLFISDYIAEINNYNATEYNTDKIKFMTIDTESILKTKDKIVYIDTLKRELADDNKVKLILILSFANVPKQFSLTIDNYKDKYVVTENLKPVSYIISKLSDEELSLYEDTLVKKEENNVNDELTKSKINSSIELFFNSYNNNREKLKSTVPFILNDYGSSTFDVKSIELSSIYKSSTSNEYIVIVKINQKEVNYTVDSLFKFTLNKDIQIINLQ